MKFVSNIALALALAAGMGGLAAAPAFAAKKEAAPADPTKFSPTLSKEFRAAVQPFQKALQAKDYTTAQSLLPAVQTAAQSPDEKFYVGQFEIAIGQGTNNQALTKTGVMDALNSGSQGVVPDRGKFSWYAGQWAYQDKNYPQAIQYLTAAKEGGYQPLDANQQPTRDVDILLAETYFKSNQMQKGSAILEQAIQAEKAANRKPPLDWYRRAASVAYQAKMMPEVSKWTRLELVDYPTPENWRDALVIYGDSAHLDDQAHIDLLRLQRAAGALTGERDYYEYAVLADKLGLPGEAKAVVDQGIAKGSFDRNSKAINEIGTVAGGRVASDRASLAGAEKSSASAATGKVAQGTADAYLGYGDYAKAAALYRVALQKGGVDANLVNTRLGIALALGGDKAAALQAFQSVSGPRKELADFWTLWLNQGARAA